MLNLPANARWSQNGENVAGRNGRGSADYQLDRPYGIDIDNDNQSIVVADFSNHRIVEWKMGANNGRVIACDRGQGNRLDPLHDPTDVLIDKETNSLFIADRGNGRVLRWSRHEGTTQGEVMVRNINCWGLAMDHQRYLYVSDWHKHEVQRYTIGDMNGIAVAGRIGRRSQMYQLNYPTYLFVDEEQAVYVSDTENHRVMKWNRDANEGILVAGGRGKGSAETQLDCPHGFFVDKSGAIYVADSSNHRVMRWAQNAQQGDRIVGGNGDGSRANQLDNPAGLSFDRDGNMYVVDHSNHRVQRFNIL